MEQSMALSHSHQRSFNCYSCAMQEISLQNGAKQKRPRVNGGGDTASNSTIPHTVSYRNADTNLSSFFPFRSVLFMVIVQQQQQQIHTSECLQVHVTSLLKTCTEFTIHNYHKMFLLIRQRAVTIFILSAHCHFVIYTYRCLRSTIIIHSLLLTAPTVVHGRRYTEILIILLLLLLSFHISYHRINWMNEIRSRW